MTSLSLDAPNTVLCANTLGYQSTDTRWDTTPPALIRDSGELSRVRILRSTHEHMETLTYATWVRHFLNKSTNENAIIDYTVQVNDAAQSFQTATLIDIHYVVSGSTKKTISKPHSSPPPYRPDDSIQSRNDSISSA
ncbi:hypothetical protein H2248_002627 [Termitomyces sp. 'cryptogamus']|nr:hypothetical protein H2248_002627 [Termitomyces sp. 'cryptogamus']